MSADANSFREEILRDTMEELATLRKKTLALPDQSMVEAAIETIDFYEAELPSFINPFQLIEWCGRALADVHHEVAAAEFGWESPEADAVYDEQESHLKDLFLRLRQVQEARSKSAA